jgi:hypothetical protein
MSELWSQTFSLRRQEVEQAAAAYVEAPESILTAADLQCILYGRFAKLLGHRPTTLKL